VTRRAPDAWTSGPAGGTRHRAADGTGRPRRGSHSAASPQGFGRLVGWTILGTVVPGTGLLVAGRRIAGSTALVVLGGLSLGGVAALGYARSKGVSGITPILVRIGFSPSSLLYIAATVVVLASLWVAVTVGTHVSLRRFTLLTGAQNVLAGALVLALVGAVAVPAAEVTRLVLIQRDLVTSVFADGGSRKGTDPDLGGADPWAGVPRVNVLLLGGDDGRGRTGVRPDTIILASIDTRTGDTLIFSIPRQIQQAPFPPGTTGYRAWPYGFGPALEREQTEADCTVTGQPCFFYAIWRTAEEHREYFPGDPNPGLTATKQAVEGILGLHVDYYGKVNLRGFAEFVDAIGGLRLNVKKNLPIGGGENKVTGGQNPITGWIRKGDNRLLDGDDALWFARSRAMSTNWERMARQQCVIGALADQAEPMKVALAYPRIARSAKRNITTDIPYQQVDAWVELATRVQKAQVRSLVIDHEIFGSDFHPDYAAIRQAVQTALTTPPAPRRTTTPGATPSPTATPGRTPRTTAPPDVPQDVTDIC